MSKDELNFWQEWIPKITERLTLVLIKAQDGKDLGEDDYELLRVLHDCIYSPGALPLFKSKLNIVAEVAVQNGLFSDNVSATANGTEIDYIPVD